MLCSPCCKSLHTVDVEVFTHLDGDLDLADLWLTFDLLSAWEDYDGYGSLDRHGAWRRWSFNEKHLIPHSPSNHRGKKPWAKLCPLIIGGGHITGSEI